MRKYLLLVLIAIIAAGCTTSSSDSDLTPTVPTETAAPTATLTPTATFTPLPPTATPIPYTEISSPLENISLAEIELVNTNPYDPPPIGFDEPHQGIDYAYYRFQNEFMDDIDGIEGLGVLSVLDGKVASIINNRMPYGNGIIIETPFTLIPDVWLQVFNFPEVSPTIVPDNRHNCPDLEDDPSWDLSNRSVYLVYGHLQYPAEFQIGDTMESGQLIGLVGNTGNSSNAHLHLELRIGPSDAVFPSMAKYDTRASMDEMRNYCIWRISNRFQLVDPNLILLLDQ